MNSTTLANYRLLRGLVSGKRILDLRPDSQLGAAMLREAGNEVNSSAPYDLLIAFGNLGLEEDVRVTLNRLRTQLNDGGVFAVSSRIAPASGMDPESRSVVFRFETLAKLLQDYFRVVTYAFLHGEEFRAEWNQYSDRVIFFCRFLKPTQLAETGPFFDRLDIVYGGTTKGLLPFSLPFLRSWLNPPSTEDPSVDKGSLLFFLQPLPLYDDPLLYQFFFERYYLLGEQYRELGWNVHYSTTAELKTLYGAERTFCPEDYFHSPHVRDWRDVYAKTLDERIPLDHPDVAYWAEYTKFVLDQTRPDAVFVWNKNTLLDRLAADRDILVIHNEVGLDRNPRPATYFFDPQGVNAESSLRRLWERFRDFHLPPRAIELVETYRRRYVDPWLGAGSRSELLHSLALDPARKTILIPLQVENDSNVVLNSPFRSMSHFCESVLEALPASEYNVIVKPHPADPLGVRLSPSVSARARVLPGGCPTGPLLAASDCVFTISSTMGYEALLAGKPVVTFGRSVYSHLGFTLDLENASQLADLDLPLLVPQEPLLNKFIFLASCLYLVSERTITSAKEQEPVLQRWLGYKRAAADVAAYWPGPASIDWERFCFEKMAEWLDQPVPASVLTSLDSSETLQSSLDALDKEYGITLKRLEDARAELNREQQNARELLAREQRRYLAELETASQHSANLSQQLEAGSVKNRQLEMDLSASRKRFAELEAAAEALRVANESFLKRALHLFLDFFRFLVPGPLRRAVRPFYLNRFYYRLYPEKRPKPAKRSNAPAAISGYAPFLDYKDRLLGGLPQDFRSVSIPSQRGLVSVVLPVYNGARYVAQSIESVLRQSYQNLELIIVDDGSTDSTPRILESYRADPRVRIIQQQNKKLPTALNAGFAQATGEYRTWTSDDNVMLPEMLATLVDFLNRQSAVEMVYADQEVIDEDGQPLLNSDYCPGYQTPPGGNLICWPRDTGELNFIQNNYLGGCFLYRAWAGSLVGDYGAARFGFEDYDYWMRMNALFRVRHLGQRKSLYRYRLHDQSLSARDGELRITERVRDFMKFEAERRSFFLEPFDVTLLGNHPEFSKMAAAYRRAGHNVFEAQEWNEKSRYHYDVTRAFSKSLAIVSGDAALQVDGAVMVRFSEGPECSVELDGVKKRLRANSAEHLIYPIVAAANSMSHAHHREESRLASLQHA